MRKFTHRDSLDNRVATPHDEDGVIRNVPDSRPYLPRDPGRRERLLHLLMRASINKEASRI